MSIQSNLLQKFMQKALEKEREMVPRIFVPLGCDTNIAIENAILQGFPVTHGSPKFVAPCIQSVNTH